MKYLLTILITFSVVLAACAAPQPPVNEEPDMEPSNDQPITEPNTDQPDDALPTSTPEELPTPEKSGNMVASQAYVYGASLLVMESYPVQVSVSISGDLPTPCHTLVIKQQEVTANNEIYIDVSSEIDMLVTCIQKLEPFDTSYSIDLSNLADGEYSVYVNGELIDSFTYPG